LSARAPHFSARIALLDKQLVDSDRLPVGRVDDVELVVSADGDAPHVEALLTGAQALGQRIGGLTGGLMAATAARLRSSPDGPTRIEMQLVEQIDPMVKLRVPLRQLPQVAALERWLAVRVERLPGAGDAFE
jgi:hypothetical protein